jgi:putative oxidoreductase
MRPVIPRIRANDGEKGKTVELTKTMVVRRIFEIALGGLFFYAGLQKLLHPYAFAEAVMAYQLLPMALVGVVAAVLPWIEVVAGLCLMVGLKCRSGLLLLSGLLVVFFAVILITMARGLHIDCGCGLFTRRLVGPAALLEDLFLLAWATSLYSWERLAGRQVLRFASKTEN